MTHRTDSERVDFALHFMQQKADVLTEIALLLSELVDAVDGGPDGDGPSEQDEWLRLRRAVDACHEHSGEAQSALMRIQRGRQR